MENPATWGTAEKIVSKVLSETDNILPEFICGLSLERRITDALREAGLLKEGNEEEGEEDSRAADNQADLPAGRPQEPEVRDGAVV